MLLLIISFLVIAAYTAAVCIKAKGVPYSISATYYKLEHKHWFMAYNVGLTYRIVNAGRYWK